MDDEPSYELRQENKVAISAFFIFPPRHAGLTSSDRSFFPLKMAIENLSVYLFLFFFPSDMQEKPLSESVIRRIYCELPNCLISRLSAGDQKV